MIQKILTLFFGSKYERDIKSFKPIVNKINEIEQEYIPLSDDALKVKTNEFRIRLQNGESLDDILPEAFACVRLAAERTLGLKHYDVQLMGGIALHQGRIAEMKTGEGKTLTSTLSIYLNSLNGKGVHVVTVNDYLAKRDADWMRPIYDFLGLSVGSITSQMPHNARQMAYRCDVIYGTNNEFGFDYLRDNTVEHISLKVQGPHAYAIVDEVDSILIDEARTPLIISGAVEQETQIYNQINGIIPSLTDKDDYEIDEKSNNVLLTELGVAKVEKLLKVENLYDPSHVDLVHHVHQALKAHTLFQKDVDYVIQSGNIIIVDEFTGRLMEGRRYSDGLHQAIEAKERVPVKQENQTLASITFQNYFRMYDKLAGMTGTADTEAEEFKKIYKLDVVVLPTHRAMARNDFPDKIYRTQAEKLNAIVQDIQDCNAKGQPILVGTVSIEKSEAISNLLRKKHIPHAVLNAKHHDKEAHIIKDAGSKGKVTIATNMAGRGTDIVLGEGVLDCGGLYIIGSERHESRRIDNQLRGRAGRQGDPGASRFYLSLEDDLMRIFGSDRMGPIMQKLGMKEGESIEHKMVSGAIERAQKRVEGHNFDIRKHLLEYDDVMDQQRKYIYSMRNQILTEKTIHEEILAFFDDVIHSKLAEFFPAKNHDAWDYGGFSVWIDTLLGVDLSQHGIDKKSIEQGQIEPQLKAIMLDKYQEKEKAIGTENLYLLERLVALQVIDQKWKDHLYNIDQLREGIWTMGYAEKNPLVEYRFQSFSLFEDSISVFKEELIEYIFRAQIQGNLEEAVPVEQEFLGEAVHSTLEQYAVHNDPNSAKIRRMPNSSNKVNGGSSKRKSNRRKRR